jgi:membrane-bound ClpP family serine protease
VLFTLIGLMRLARVARTRWSRTLLLVGAMVTVAGISLPNGAVLIPGILLLLVGILSPSSRDTPTDSADRLDAALVHRR